MATIKGNSGNNNLTGTTGNDFIYGYDGLDTLTGLAGNDRLEAGNGNDSLDGGTGADTMIGGSGDDTYIVDSLSDVVTEFSGGGVDTIKTSLSYTLGENYVNNLILTGSGNINGTGNSYDNVITGNGANNTLKGNAGKDTLNGGNGIDTLIGGKGDDTYIIDTTLDLIVEVPGEGVDTILSSVSYTLDENYVNNLTLTGSSDLNGTGNSYNNVITGNDGYNLLKGGDGNDTIYGEYYDTLYGEKGNDLLDGGSYGAYSYGGDGNDTLIGEGSKFGESGNDSLTIKPYEVSYGGLGNDTITFYNEYYYDYYDGSYYYYGGTIGFNTPNEGVDTIYNFQSGVNEIYISASVFGGGLTQYSYLTSEQFKYGSSASTANQRFLYDTNTGYLRFDVDGSGSAAAKNLAILQGAPTLTVDDFYVI
jgi:Ca2+-binding RTX toxin-like protein